MRLFCFRVWITVCLLLLLPSLGMAAVPAWQIDPSASSITFTGTQNNAPTSGKFKTFSGKINFDPNQLASSHVRIVVDMNSVSTSYAEVANNLKTADWFDTVHFPQAVFTTNTFHKTAATAYTAQGMLQIRDKTVPITLDFVVKEHSATHALVEGSTTLKRTAFGVGRGEWASTDEVQDAVKVNFLLALTKK